MARFFKQGLFREPNQESPNLALGLLCLYGGIPGGVDSVGPIWIAAVNSDGVWIEAAQGGQFGLKPVDFARYFISAFIARQLTVVWVVWEFEREVVEGRLSPRLLQPDDPVWHHVASHLSERLARLPFTLLLIVLFFVLYPQAFWVPSLSQLLLFLLAIAWPLFCAFSSSTPLPYLPSGQGEPVPLSSFGCCFSCFFLA